MLIKINDNDFNQEIVGQTQGFKTGWMTVGWDNCMVDDIMARDGLKLAMATQAEKDIACFKTEDEVIVMLHVQRHDMEGSGTWKKHMQWEKHTPHFVTQHVLLSR